MVSKNIYTFATQMEKKYPEITIDIPEWNKQASCGRIEVALRNDPSHKLEMEAILAADVQKLVFYDYGSGKEVPSFRKAMTLFIRGAGPQKETAKELKQTLKQKIHKMIRNASPMEVELVWLPRIMANQMEEEKDYKATIEHNGVGLTKADAYPLTRYYNSITKYGRHLSKEDAEDIKERIPKYWKQYAAMMEA